MPDQPAGGLFVRAVSKSYGRVKALDNVDINLDVGEFVALLGQNGSGKTTLFQLLSGLFTPDAGEIIIAGVDVRKNAVPALAKLGIVFQTPTLDPELSVRANLLYHTRLFGIREREAKQRIATAIEDFALTERAGEKVRVLSGGNRRKVELARALLHDPELLLMDEPTVGLDPASRRDMLERVLALRSEGRIGVLWATHLVDEAESADRVVILHRGRILENDTPAALTEKSGEATLADAFLALTSDADGGTGKTATPAK